MLKSPDRPNAGVPVLDGVALGAIGEELEPRVERIVLRRGPVEVSIEPERTGGKRAILGTRTGTGRWGGRIAGVVTHRVQFIL